MPNHLKDVQAINMHVGLNCAEQAAYYVDRLFSSNVWTNSPLWHCVGKSWSLGPRSSCSILHRWRCSPQLGPTALPSQSDCLTSSGLMACSSGLTSFVGKYGNSSHGKNCHLVQLSWLPYTYIRIISLKTIIFLVSKVRIWSSFSPFPPPKPYI